MAEHDFQGSPRVGAALSAVRAAALELKGATRDYTPLIDVLGTARFALLGEASHGTHEFYRERAEITKRLITEKRYTAVAVEADWPDAYRVNQYVRAVSEDPNTNAALSGFKRFPAWMWRNSVVLEFVEWLRDYNDDQPPARKVGFYGIDLYSLFSSIDAVLQYLDRADPAAAQRARSRYSCFDHFGEDTQSYGYAASFGMSKTCEEEVVTQLAELTRKVAAHNGARVDPDDVFYAQQNARLVKNAEEYYRTMFRGHVSSWNLRDRHMVETVQALDAYLAGRGGSPRIAVWAHNSHLGDARATEMGDSGEWNVGQLMRDAYGEEAVLIGFSTDHGTVTAASDWGGNAQRKSVRPGLPGSYEELFHDVGMERFLLLLRGAHHLVEPLEAARLQRAIGVIYLPETERMSHYFHTRLVNQFDALVHFDETRAVEPLEAGSGWLEEEAPETYPTGI